MDTMKEQLLGMGLLCVITYLLLRFRDFFLTLGQDRCVSPRKRQSLAAISERPRPVGVGREPANVTFVPRASLRIQVKLRRVYVRVKQFCLRPWRSLRKEGYRTMLTPMTLTGNVSGACHPIHPVAVHAHQAAQLGILPTCLKRRGRDKAR